MGLNGWLIWREAKARNQVGQGICPAKPKIERDVLSIGLVLKS
jgi:hypothetical protein